MEPISPLNNSIGGQPPRINQAAVNLGLSGSGAMGRGSAATRPMASAVAPQQMTGVASAVSQMLRDIGGGVENNAMLELLIAIMILMALLEETKGTGGSASNPLQTLESSGRGAQQTSATQPAGMSISIQQTSISMTSTTIVAAFGSTESQLPATGQQLDRSA